MFKKLTLLGMAVAALAMLVVPAMAGATTLKEGGVPITTPAEITLTQDPSFPVVTVSETLGEIKCESIIIPGTLTKNSGGEVEGVGSEGTAKPCTVNGKAGAEVTSVTGTITSNSSEGDHGKATFDFVIDIPNLGTCTYTTVAPATGSFVTGSNTISFSKTSPAELEPSPEFCGEATLSGGLIVETPDGTPIEITS